MAITPRSRSLVAGAALLEGGGELQVLELQEHLGAGDPGQGARLDAGRLQHLAQQSLPGLADVGDLDHAGIVGRKGHAMVEQPPRRLSSM
jgi:hypothetical protein